MEVLSTSDLSGRTALVVGAGSLDGIGLAAAAALSASGARVAIADLPEANSQARLSQLAGTGHCWLDVDVTHRDQVDSTVETVAARFGGIDIVINAAAILRTAPFLEATVVDWAQSFDVNTLGAFNVAQAAARQMVARSAGGRIVLIASNVGRIPRINNVAYAASKAAVIQLARSMAMELGPSGIAVNALCPGSTVTSMLIDNQTGSDAHRLDGVIQGSVAEWRTGIPLGRLAEAADQAAMCVFLASSGGRHISGQALCVDGGQTYFL